MGFFTDVDMLEFQPAKLLISHFEATGGFHLHKHPS